MTPLRLARQRRDLTLDDVAAAVEVDISTISRIENGKQVASPALAEKLSKFFGNAVTEIEILYPERFARSTS